MDITLIGTSFSGATLVAILISIWKSGKWVQKIEDRVEHSEKELLEHRKEVDRELTCINDKHDVLQNSVDSIEKDVIEIKTHLRILKSNCPILERHKDPQC